MKLRIKYRWLALPAAFILGVYGYLLAYDNNWLGAIYSSLRLYGLNVDVSEDEINIFIQIARWLAAATTTSVIVLLFKRVFAEIGFRLKLRKKDIIVVHGDGPRKEAVIASIGKHAVPMNTNACFDVDKHILAFEEDLSAIRYLQEYESKLLSKQDGEQKKDVYFLSNEYEPSDYAQQGLIIENNAVNCARVYWKDHWLKDESERKIAIIGFGKYAQRILEQALLVNVFAWRETIEYHVFGGNKENYLNWHPQLSNVIAFDTPDAQKDSVFFHPQLSDSGILSLKQMDRIIIAEDSHEANLLCLNKLLSAGIGGVIHIRCSTQLMNHMQYLPENQTADKRATVHAFGDDARLCSSEVILHGEMNRAAKDAHISYVKNSKACNIRTKYISCKGCQKNGECGNCYQAGRTWDDLTPFDKASNIAAADHMPVKEYLLSVNKNHNEDAVKQELCRAEHERWSRFYYLHNWVYGEKRDNIARVHPCLVPFDLLSKEDQAKDWWPFESILKRSAE